LIHSISAKNFCCFEQFDLLLANRGLVWLGGDNQDSEAASSNGAGKSAVFKALGWGLYGESIDGDKGDGIIRDGTKCAIVNVNLDGGWKVVRTRHKARPSVKLMKDGKPFDCGKEVQQHIDRMVGMDWNTFRNTILYGQNDNKRFLSSKDSVRKEILHRIMRTFIFGAAYELAAERNREAKRNRDKNLDAIRILNAKIEEYDLDAAWLLMESWETARAERVKQLRQHARDHTAIAKRIANSIPDTSGMESRMSKARSQCKIAKRVAARLEALGRDLDVARETVNMDRAAHHVECSKLEAIHAALAKLKGADRCPVCNSRLDVGDAATHMGELKATQFALEESVNASLAIVGKSKAKMLSLVKQYDEARQCEHKACDLEVLIAQLGSEIKAANSTVELAKITLDEARVALRTAKEHSSEENPHEAHYWLAKSKINEFKKQIMARQELIDGIESERAHVEFWVHGFGITGLPSFVLDSAMPLLTERANHYLDSLADGDITMQFSTQRELKSVAGEYRDEISVSWEIEGISGHPPSGGQFKKMEIATDLSLMDLAAGEARPNLLLMDECLDGLDAEGRTRVVKLLHDLRKHRRSIFVISHDAGMAEMFEHSVIATKHDGMTTLKEVV
jgi:DNA repair exonuclease SbcCD ATPase subunit